MRCGDGIQTLGTQIRTNIVSEIDTDVECEPFGMVPEVELKRRSLKSQESADRPLSNVPDKTCILYKEGQRDGTRRVLMKKQNVVQEKGVDLTRWAIPESGI